MNEEKRIGWSLPDGGYWTPDGNVKFVVRGKHVYFETGDIKENFGCWRTIPGKSNVDYSLWTNEERAVAKAAFDAEIKANRTKHEQQVQLAETAKAKLTPDELSAILETS